MAKKQNKELLGVDLPGVKITHQHTSKWDKSVHTHYTIGSTSVHEIVYSDDPADAEKDSPRAAVEPNRMKKEARIEIIKSMLKAKKSRDEIKKAMYNQLIYKGNPNPASAFAGDWKAAN